MPSPADQVSVTQIAEAIGRGPDSWTGDCYRVAQHVLETGVVPGRWVRGTYAGDGHAWVELPDGRVFDPTQWTMTGADPFVYVGPLTEQYHETGPGRFDHDVAHLTAHHPA